MEEEPNSNQNENVKSCFSFVSINIKGRQSYGTSGFDKSKCGKYKVGVAV